MKILDFPEAVVSAYVLILCFIGALSIRNNVTDLWLIIGFGVLGYGFERLKFPVAPLVLGVILGPIAEEAFMNTMISFSNDWTVFFTRPISGNDRRVHHHRPAAAIRAASAQKPPGDGSNRG